MKAIELISKEEEAAAGDGVSSYGDRVWWSPEMGAMRMAEVKRAVEMIEERWSPDLEADIKAACLISDVYLDYIRDMHCREVQEDGSTTRAELWPGSGRWEIWMPQWASRYMRNKAQMERNQNRGLEVIAFASL